jgi:hypothetical protein
MTRAARKAVMACSAPAQQEDDRFSGTLLFGHYRAVRVIGENMAPAFMHLDWALVDTENAIVSSAGCIYAFLAYDDFFHQWGQPRIARIYYAREPDNPMRLDCSRIQCVSENKHVRTYEYAYTDAEVRILGRVVARITEYGIYDSIEKLRRELRRIEDGKPWPG